MSYKSHQSLNTKSILSTILVSSAFLTFPAMARAELTMNGAFDLEFARNSDTSINTKRVGGSFGGIVWKDFGIQADIGLGKHEQYTSTTAEATVHLFVQPQDDLALGVYLTGEDRRPGNSYFYGAEVAYTADLFSIEAFAAYRDDIAADTDGSRWGLEAAVTPLPATPIAFWAGYVEDTGVPVSRSFAYVGASYEIIEGIDIGIEAGQTDEGANIAGISATFTFGSGRTFSPRDSFTLYPGY